MVLLFDRTLKAILLAIALFLGMIAVRPFIQPEKVQAQAARFDHVQLLSMMFLYKGQQGLLVTDRRNGNVWFIPKVDEVFRDPIFVVQMHWEKLDQAPR